MSARKRDDDDGFTCGLPRIYEYPIYDFLPGNFGIATQDKWAAHLAREIGRVSAFSFLYDNRRYGEGILTVRTYELRIHVWIGVRSYEFGDCWGVQG